MSRKRLAPVRYFSNGVPLPYMQNYQYEYYRPGCYYIPVIEREVTPYNNTYMNQWMPYCNTATYVIDRYGRANYLSDFEYQLQVPTQSLTQPHVREVIYNFYNDGEVELSSLPQIEEEDIDDDNQDNHLPKRKRYNSKNHLENTPTNFTELQGDECRSNDNENSENNGNVYRSNEGYLVEEPSDNVLDKVEDI